MSYRERFMVAEIGRRCPCGKMGFGKKDAQTKRNLLLRRGNEKYLRIYQCPVSNAWHLTHGKDRVR